METSKHFSAKIKRFARALLKDSYTSLSQHALHSHVEEMATSALIDEPDGLAAHLANQYTSCYSPMQTKTGSVNFSPVASAFILLMIDTLNQSEALFINRELSYEPNHPLKISHTHTLLS